VFFTDVGSKFFELFDFKAVDGSLHGAFRNANSVVLTRSMATTLFGDSRAVGKVLDFDTLHLSVTAVIEDLPSNTNFDFQVLIANDQAMEQASALATFCQLVPGADPQKIVGHLLRHEVPASDFSRLQDARIIPLRDLHFEANMMFETKAAGNRVYLVIFTIIGSSILVLTVFNFVNLSVAVYAQRTKEIAVRKIVGAAAGQIARQFLTESMVVVFIGLPFIVLFVQVMLPWFNSLMGIHLENYFASSLGGFILIVSATATVGVMAGAYPAWVLPRISSLAAFRKDRMVIGSFNLRSVLVSMQVTVMIMILCGTWIINGQLNFLMESDLGFEKDGLIKLKGAWTVDSLQYSRIKRRLLNNPNVLNVSNGFAPGDEDYGFPYRLENSDEIRTDLIAFGTDMDYIHTLGLQITRLREGIDLENSRSLVLINETLARSTGEPVGQCIIISPGKKHERKKIVDGVFADFHFFSLHQQVTPMMLTLRPFGSGINENILVKVKAGEVTETMAYINTVVREEAPHVPLTAEFIDDTLARLYQKEKQLSFFSTLLLVVTALLSVIGLVGLSSYIATLKTKEIGIRKVLGAGIRDLVLLVSKPFIRIAFVAFLIGSLISFQLLDQWLASFAYRIPVTWHVFGYTLMALIALLLVTVGGHALNAAHTDPVKSIRSE
ncbi:MAG TPA: FtsX-like permease family protein, partial [Chryseosolibacter sp.]|nr:FtsX-like permease family protein [Chryseosolibacter sp.]